MHNLNELLICHWFILSLFRCCDFASSLLFSFCSLAFLALLLQSLFLQFAASFPVLLIFFMSCKRTSSLASLSPAWEQRPGNRRYRVEVERKERGALSWRGLKKKLNYQFTGKGWQCWFESLPCIPRTHEERELPYCCQITYSTSPCISGRKQRGGITTQLCFCLRPGLRIQMFPSTAILGSEP